MRAGFLYEKTPPPPTAPLAKISVIANQPAGWCGKPYSPRTALPHGEDGFPRRCAPRNDSFYENHPAMRRGGVLPRPPDMLPNSENGRGRAAAPTHTLYFPCRAAPVCAAVHVFLTNKKQAPTEVSACNKLNQRLLNCRGVKKMCRWHIFSLRPQQLCCEDASVPKKQGLPQKRKSLQ